MDGAALNEDCRPFAQSPRRRFGDSRRCGPAYQTERAALPMCRRSSSPSRRSVNFLKRQLHCSGCVQPASGNLGASAVSNLRPASSFAASQQSPDETTDTPEYAPPLVLRPPAVPGVARLSVGTQRPVSSEGSASVSKCARENCDGARQSGAVVKRHKPRRSVASVDLMKPYRLKSGQAAPPPRVGIDKEAPGKIAGNYVNWPRAHALGLPRS